MTNSSATGGYLQPTPPPPAPLEGEDLEDFFHDWLAGLSGLDNTLIRPAWQPESANIPVKATVWCAFHFIDTYSDAFPYVGQFTEGGVTQQSQLQNNEEFNVHCSLYGTGAGSNARAVAKLIRDNAMVPQNQEVLRANGFALIASPSPPQPAPQLIKNIWLYRVDLDIPIRRMIVRNYNVITIETAQVQFDIQLETNEITREITVEDT